MPFYLSEYIGTGTKADPFRPVGSDQDGWSAIDIRDDPNAPGGQCLLRTPVAFSDARARFLANDKLENLTNPQKNFLTNRLGVDLSSTSLLRDIIAIIMNQPPPGRWNPIRPGLLKWEIWLGELIWEAPRISGGSSLADNFNRSNRALDGDNGWIKTLNAFHTVSISSNELINATAVSDDQIYTNPGAAATNDQYAQMRGVTSAFGDWGPLVRGASTAGTVEQGYLIAVALQQLARFTPGFSSISPQPTDHTSWTTGDTHRITVNGSTILGYRNGVVWPGVSPVSDTFITSGAPGFFQFDTEHLDDWDGGDLGALPEKQTYYRQRRVMVQR